MKTINKIGTICALLGALYTAQPAYAGGGWGKPEKRAQGESLPLGFDKVQEQTKQTQTADAEIHYHIYVIEKEGQEPAKTVEQKIKAELESILKTDYKVEEKKRLRFYGSDIRYNPESFIKVIEILNSDKVKKTFDILNKRYDLKFDVNHTEHFAKCLDVLSQDKDTISNLVDPKVEDTFKGLKSKLEYEFLLDTERINSLVELSSDKDRVKELLDNDTIKFFNKVKSTVGNYRFGFTIDQADVLIKGGEQKNKLTTTLEVLSKAEYSIGSKLSNEELDMIIEVSKDKNNLKVIDLLYKEFGNTCYPSWTFTSDQLANIQDFAKKYDKVEKIVTILSKNGTTIGEKLSDNEAKSFLKLADADASKIIDLLYSTFGHTCYPSWSFTTNQTDTIIALAKNSTDVKETIETLDSIGLTIGEKLSPQESNMIVNLANNKNANKVLTLLYTTFGNTCYPSWSFTNEQLSNVLHFADKYDTVSKIVSTLSDIGVTIGEKLSDNEKISLLKLADADASETMRLLYTTFGNTCYPSWDFTTDQTDNIITLTKNQNDVKETIETLDSINITIGEKLSPNETNMITSLANQENANKVLTFLYGTFGNTSYPSWSYTNDQLQNVLGLAKNYNNIKETVKTFNSIEITIGEKLSDNETVLINDLANTKGTNDILLSLYKNFGNRSYPSWSFTSDQKDQVIELANTKGAIRALDFLGNKGYSIGEKLGHKEVQKVKALADVDNFDQLEKLYELINPSNRW